MDESGLIFSEYVREKQANLYKLVAVCMLNKTERHNVFAWPEFLLFLLYLAYIRPLKLIGDLVEGTFH